jgi:protein-S-isoprenylcysteine O-methyltransferase Ste14
MFSASERSGKGLGVDDTSIDPVDHARTTRLHVGESKKNGANAPGLIVVAIGVVALVICLASLAGSANVAHARLAGVVAVAAFCGGAIWLWAHRRVRLSKQRWVAEHPEADAQPPSS